MLTIIKKHLMYFIYGLPDASTTLKKKFYLRWWKKTLWRSHHQRFPISNPPWIYKLCCLVSPEHISNDRHCMAWTSICTTWSWRLGETRTLQYEVPCQDSESLWQIWHRTLRAVLVHNIWAMLQWLPIVAIIDSNVSNVRADHNESDTGIYIYIIHGMYHGNGNVPF